MHTSHRSRRSFLAIAVLFAVTNSALVATSAHATTTNSLDANKALALRYQHEIFEQGNLAVADEILAPDFVWYYPPDEPFAVGAEGVKEQATALRAYYANDLVLTDDDVIAEGDRVVIRWTLVGNAHRESGGAPVTVTGIDIFRVADGHLAELWQDFAELGLQRASAESVPFLP
jgi:ketosteroid isomerase-like protein